MWKLTCKVTDREMQNSTISFTERRLARKACTLLLHAVMIAQASAVNNVGTKKAPGKNRKLPFAVRSHKWTSLIIIWLTIDYTRSFLRLIIYLKAYSKYHVTFFVTLQKIIRHKIKIFLMTLLWDEVRKALK